MSIDTNIEAAVSSPKVAIRAVERYFGGSGAVHALGPIDLDVAEGDFICLVGPSGCGKSTLIRIIAGLLEPSSGAVALTVTPQRRHIATVFQEYGLFPWKTVRENIVFGVHSANNSRAEAGARADKWLGRLGLKDFANAYPATLSGGMRQRVAIARALAMEPEILLMDEPFGALDAQMREILQIELLELCQADRRTVIFVTHSLEEALILGDRVIVMTARPGQVLEDIEVPFARPRDASVRSSAKFAEMRDHLWARLREQVEVHLPGSGNNPDKAQ